MINLIKRFKFLYALYNFFHRKKLVHNEHLFKKIGLRKKYYSSLSSKDFARFDSGTSTTDSNLKERLNSSALFNSLPIQDQESLLSFHQNGFAVIHNFLSAEEVEEINAEVERLLQKNKIRFTNRNKIMMAIRVSPLLRGIGNNEKLKELLAALLDGKAILFQSINFLKGSEQPTHSDSIHMTTFPLGGLLGAWFALDDISDDNGPLHYYPGSHQLPYYLNSDYQNQGNRFLLGSKSYAAYEAMIRAKINNNRLQKSIFLAKKGDLLIWHANLFHGGEQHINKNKTRKSMVLHYFKENVVCYHEITQRPALIGRYP